MNDDVIKTYAGFWQRVKAFAFDYVIILFYLAAITLFLLLLNSLFRLNSWLFTDHFRAQLVGSLLVTLPVTLYFAISESSKQQATWGKRLIGLKVTDYDSARISFLRSFARTLLKFIPWELSHILIWNISFSAGASSRMVNYGFGLVYFLVGLNIASLIMTRKRQTIYDLIMKTYVVQQTS